MATIIVCQADDLKNCLKDALCELLPEGIIKSTMPETMTLDSAVNFLKENGYPTSKGKLYKLTSKKEVPHFKYGHKLVFSRSDLLEWAKNQSTRQMTAEEILEEMDQRMKRKRA